MPLAAYTHLIRDVPDFPKPGIVFKDITPLLQDPAGFRAAILALAALVTPWRPDRVLGIESRGFLFASALAYALGSGMVIVRKPGKLPSNCVRQTYALEYGTDTLEMHADAIIPGQRIVVVDDVLATGGTAQATLDLVRSVGGHAVGAAFLIELGFLGGRQRLGDVPVGALLRY
ncbi:MAG: adenine phosphoribosyltransferase [Myxococcales bacterium]|nr:adenine phosphoribosyltransferase [Myxococcales bacterium]